MSLASVGFEFEAIYVWGPNEGGRTPPDVSKTEREGHLSKTGKKKLSEMEKRPVIQIRR